MPEADAVDHAAFDRLRSAVDRARRRRQLWGVVLVAAISVTFVVVWSAAFPALLGLG